jgi:hypothetical protein
VGRPGSEHRRPAGRRRSDTDNLPHLNEELVPPTVEGLEALAGVDIVDEYTAVGTAVERNTERLEALLAGRVPQLHRHDAVVDNELAGEEVGACRMVSGDGRA